MEKAAKKRKKRRFRARFLLLAAGALLYAFIMVIHSQSEKLSEIKSEQEALTEEYIALQNEETRLERMIEYAKTDEYRIQYAREKLGYVLPDDIQFDLGEE